jgi:glutaminyl-tRNA synthetase
MPVGAELRLYDRLFKETYPGAGDKDFLKELNEDSLKTVTAYVELTLANVLGGRALSLNGMGTL